MHTVDLYVYDLSKGLAKQMSMALTGKQFDGIWHTSIVVHNTEHYYSQGINSIPPTSSEHGILTKKIPMGHTTLSHEEITQIIKKMEPKFTADAYHIIENNCNHFTDMLLFEICGAKCPEDIMSLAREVMATPFGAMVKPLFDNLFVGKRKINVSEAEVREQLNEVMSKEQGDMIYGVLQSALD